MKTTNKALTLVLLLSLVITMNLSPVRGNTDQLTEWLTDAIKAGVALSTFFKILFSADFKNPITRGFFLKLIPKEHGGEYNIAQLCDIWDYCFQNWSYVSDPAFLEYVAPASETINYSDLRGDCDDFAALIAAGVRVIGGCAMVAVERTANYGHAFPVVYISWTIEESRPIVRYICNRYSIDAADIIVFPTGDLGVWLSLDRTARHPGGKRWIDFKYVESNFNVPIFRLWHFSDMTTLVAPIVEW